MGITIADVAGRAGVSTATVSRYLNQPALVSEEKQDQISRAIADLNYVPNHMAKALTTNHTNTVGVIVPDINNVYYPPIVRAIEDVLEHSGYISILCNTDQNTEKEKSYITMLRAQKAAGALFIGSRPSNPSLSRHLLKLREYLPIVMVNDDLLVGGISSIGNHEEAGICQAVSYLYSLGHTRIGFLNSASALNTYRYKESGFRHAIHQLSITNCEKWICVIEKEYEPGGFEAMNLLLKEQADLPTAIVAATDQMAVGAIHALLEKGYRIPEDFSIVGYSNSYISETTYPGITTVDQHGQQLGQEAARKLISIIEGSCDDHSAHYLDTQLVIRKSTGFCDTGKKH